MNIHNSSLSNCSVLGATGQKVNNWESTCQQISFCCIKRITLFCIRKLMVNMNCPNLSANVVTSVGSTLSLTPRLGLIHPEQLWSVNGWGVQGFS